MKSRGLIVLSLGCLTLTLAGCQKAASSAGQTIGLVQDSGGTVYDISCLRTYATQIQSQGRSAMEPCAQTAAHHNAYVSSGYTYYPPYYWSPQSAYAYSNPVSAAYNYNYFCSFTFGMAWDASCYYDLFLFNPSSYGSYNSQCASCLSYSMLTQSYCFSACSQSWTFPY